MERAELIATVTKAQSGDAEAARLLFESHRTAVWHLALRYVKGDQEKAKDIMQTSFMTAFSKINKLQQPSRFSGWLLQITANEALQLIRRDSRQQANHQRFSEEQSLFPTQEDPVLREIKIKAVKDVLAQMPETKESTIAKLHYGDPPMSTTEIQKQLGIPRGTVTVSLKRFRNRIKARLVRKILSLESNHE